MTTTNIDKNKDLLKSYIINSCIKLNKEREVISAKTKDFIVETSSDVLDSFVNFQHRERSSSKGLSPELDKLPKVSLDMAKSFYTDLLKDVSGAQSSDQNSQVKLCVETMTGRLTGSFVEDEDLIAYLNATESRFTTITSKHSPENSAINPSGQKLYQAAKQRA